MALGSTLATPEVRKAKRTIHPRGVKARYARTRMTPRLRQVMECIEFGMSDEDIAKRLDLSVGSVRVYAHEIYKFTGKTRFEIRLSHRVPQNEPAEGLPRMGAFE
jgi:DNA-binding NarL/FixJ family response regulator